MSLERNQGEDRQVFQKFTEVTETTELSVTQRVVVIGTTTANITVTLPPVEEAIGKIFSISAPTIATDTNAVTLQNKDDASVDWDGDYTLDADGDAILLYSDGRIWWVLENRIA